MLITRLIRVCLFAAALVACGGGTNSSPSAGVPSGAPSSAPTGTPTAILDPSQSDAGIVGQATVMNDATRGRDGTYNIVGVAADGSACETSFEGDEFVAAALNDSAADGQIGQMFVAVRSAELPAADGETIDGIEDGRAGFDFVSDNFGGTLYVGEPLEDERTTVSIDVTQSGSDLIFDFAATTWDGVGLSGQMICADVV